MLNICEFSEMIIKKEVDFGVYLSLPDDSEREVLLPKKEVPEGVKPGDVLNVFLYLDSSDRPVATLKKPYITMGKAALLEVVQVTPIGVFLNWGLDKDLLLPFREQVKIFVYDPSNGKSEERDPQEGDKVPVSLYVDKTKRPAATMRVYNHLIIGGDYVKDSAVECMVISVNPELGVFVAVEKKYFGMIPIREIHDRISLGDILYGRVSYVRDDGKYMISLTRKAHIQMDEDSAIIFNELVKSGGIVPFGDKSSAEAISRRFHMSKAAFKRAIGALYREKRIILEPERIILKDSAKEENNNEKDNDR